MKINWGKNVQYLISSLTPRLERKLFIEVQEAVKVKREKIIHKLMGTVRKEIVVFLEQDNEITHYPIFPLDAVLLPVYKANK